MGCSKRFQNSRGRSGRRLIWRLLILRPMNAMSGVEDWRDILDTLHRITAGGDHRGYCPSLDGAFRIFLSLRNFLHPHMTQSQPHRVRVFDFSDMVVPSLSRIVQGDFCPAETASVEECGLNNFCQYMCYSVILGVICSCSPRAELLYRPRAQSQVGR